MNKVKRIRLCEANDLLSKAGQIIDSVRDQEQDDFNNLPESIQDCERGAAMEEAIDHLSEAFDLISEAQNCIDSARGGY